jgi:hypothetical protein
MDFDEVEDLGGGGGLAGAHVQFLIDAGKFCRNLGLLGISDKGL